MFPKTVWHTIQQHYSEPHRAYHTWQHISECLALAPEHTVLKLAIVGHDVVYQPRAHDNEEQSAVLFADYLQQAGYTSDVVDTVSGLILATKHHVPHSEHQALMVDIDLAILGAPSERFAEYEQQIRYEYQWADSEAYRQGRRQVLQGFLSRERIYTTSEFVERYEAQARINLTRAVQQLCNVS